MQSAKFKSDVKYKSSMISNITFRKKSFGKLAEDYQKYRKPYDSKIYKKFFSLIKKLNGDINILDIGCGTGKSTEPLLTEAPKKFIKNLEVIGCDHDLLMLKYARSSADKKNLPIKYIFGKAEKLPFKDESFDAVIAGTAFHWFADRKAFSEIKRILKTGGFFFDFWKGPTDTTIKGKWVGQEVYDKYKCTSVIKMWRNIDRTKKLFNSAGFKKFNSFSVFEVQKDSIEELIGDHRSKSKYAALSPGDRNGFIKEMTAAYKKALGRKKLFVSKRESTVCYAFK